MFVAEEEHEGDWVVQFYKRDISATLEKKTLDNQYKNCPITKVLLTVHLFEVGNLVEVADVDDGEVLDTICDP